MTDIQIGQHYKFAYPKVFTTLPQYTLRIGLIAKVVRQLTQEEADQGDGMERMFLININGWEGHAWESELILLTQDEFVKEVKLRLPFRFRDRVDIECINSIIAQDYRNGYSLDDARKSVYYTEHVSPQFSEEYGCRKISEIDAKYRSPKGA